MPLWLRTCWTELPARTARENGPRELLASIQFDASGFDDRAVGRQVVLHLLAEWLYLGKYPQKLQVGLLIGLAAALLIGGGWLQPKMKVLHATKYGLKNRPEIRAAADHSFRAWHGVSQVINLLMVGGLTVYLWRATNPSDPTRFVSATKFAMR